MNISFYITSYTAKKQNHNYGMSAIMVQGLAYHLQHPRPEYLDDIREDQRLLLFRITHAMSLHQVLAQPMVMAHLMGKGDVLRSHTFTPLFWNSFVGTLLKLFPLLASR